MPDLPAQGAASVPESASEPAAALSPPETPGSGADSSAPAKPTSNQFAALRMRQRAFKREQAEFKAQQAAFQSESASIRQQFAALQQQVKETTEALAAAKADPLSWAEKQGVDPNKAVRGYLQNGTPEKSIAEAREEAAQARRELADFKKSLEEKEKEHIQRSIKATDEQAVANFVTAIATNAKEWPYTNAVFTKEEISTKLMELQRIGQQRNERYSLQQVREAFERFAKQRFDQIQESHKRLFATEEVAPVPPPVSKGPSSRQPSPAKKSSPNETPGKKLTARQLEAEARAAALAQIRAGIQKDAADRAKEGSTKTKSNGAKH